MRPGKLSPLDPDRGSFLSNTAIVRAETLHAGGELCIRLEE
jgi:hypothetical protein